MNKAFFAGLSILLIVAIAFAGCAKKAAEQPPVAEEPPAGEEPAAEDLDVSVEETVDEEVIDVEEP